MVELATFRMFHRASPARQPEALPEEPSAPPEVNSQVDESLPTRFSEELRARRRAARIDMRQSGAWAEPEIAPPAGPSLAESVAFVSEAPTPVHPVAPAASDHEDGEPAFEAPLPPEAPAAEASDVPVEAGEHAFAHSPIADADPAIEHPERFFQEHAVPPSEHPGLEEDGGDIDAAAHAKASVLAAEARDFPVPGIAGHVEPIALEEHVDDTHTPHPAAYPESETLEGEYEAGHPENAAGSEGVAEPGLETSQPHARLEAEEVEPAPESDVPPSPEPIAAHRAPPVLMDDYLDAHQHSLASAPHVAEPAADVEAASPLYSEVPIEEPWPIEPPSALLDEHVLPIAPPAPLEPQTDIVPLATEVTEAPVFPREYRSDSLDLDYRLLGLANPQVCTVIGKLGDATPTQMSVGRAGIYRPDGFRPAPWSGFAYDIAPTGRMRFVLGTRTLTARGEIPVEELSPGDTALALRGPALLPILWIGRSVASPQPVEIAAGAFGPGRPGRALRVGADHPIFMETMPVAARDLVNGGTIRSLESEPVELFHVDVGFAEVLLAEGVPLASGSR